MRTLLIAGILISCAAAQIPTEPPVLVQLTRLPGGDTGASRPYSRARAAVNVFGLRSVTGLAETWLVEAHDSFASIEDLDKALNAVAQAGRANSQDDLLAPARTLVAIHRPDWSYRPDLAIKMFPKARYFYISVHQIRPGAGEDFGEIARQRRSGFDRMNLDRPDIAYQVISGAPAGTCLFLAPLSALKTLDDALTRFSGEAGARPAGKLGDIELSREHLLFRVEPRISWVSEGIAAADPDFWNGKRP